MDIDIHATGYNTEVDGHWFHATGFLNSWRMKPSGCSMIWLIGLRAPTDRCTTVTVFSAVRTSELDYAVTEVITGIALWAWFYWCLWCLTYSSDCYDIRYMYMFSRYGLLWYWKCINVLLYALWFGIWYMNALILMINECFLTCRMIRNMKYELLDFWRYMYIYMCYCVLRCYSTEFAAHPSQPTFFQAISSRKQVFGHRTRTG